MAKKPGIPHRQIVEFILSGKTTLDAKEHFGFSSDNVANTRVWAAFKALGIKRPAFEEKRTCEFCGKKYVAKRRNRQTCGSKECQQAFIVRWHQRNPEKARAANLKFKQSARGRAANREMHRRKRERGQTGTPQQRWAFALDESAKSFRKLVYMADRNPWEYRVQHIQKLSTVNREFKERPPRNLEKGIEKSRSHRAAHFWLVALRAVQTVHSQRTSAARRTFWEQAANRIYAAVNMGNRIRRWKRRASL